MGAESSISECGLDLYDPFGPLIGLDNVDISWPEPCDDFDCSCCDEDRYDHCRNFKERYPTKFMGYYTPSGDPIYDHDIRYKGKVEHQLIYFSEEQYGVLRDEFFFRHLEKFSQPLGEWSWATFYICDCDCGGKGRVGSKEHYGEGELVKGDEEALGTTQGGIDITET